MSALLPTLALLLASPNAVRAPHVKDAPELRYDWLAAEGVKLCDTGPIPQYKPCKDLQATFRKVTQVNADAKKALVGTRRWPVHIRVQRARKWLELTGYAQKTAKGPSEVRMLRIGLCDPIEVKGASLIVKGAHQLFTERAGPKGAPLRTETKVAETRIYTPSPTLVGGVHGALNALRKFHCK